MALVRLRESLIPVDLFLSLRSALDARRHVS